MSGKLQQQLMGFALNGRNSVARKMFSRGLSTEAKAKIKSVYVSEVGVSSGNTPFLLALLGYFQKHIPSTGFYDAVASPKAAAVESAFGLKSKSVSSADINKFLASGKQDEVLDNIFEGYMAVKSEKDFVVVQGTGSEIDAKIALSLDSPVVISVNAQSGNADELYSAALLRRQLFLDNKVEVAGVAASGASAEVTAALKSKFEAAGITFIGGVNAGVSAEEAKKSFEGLVSGSAVASNLEKYFKASTLRFPPRFFTYGINAACKKDPQHIVLPESLDKRVLTAAAEITARGLAKVTLLGDATYVAEEAKKLGLDLSNVNVIDPKTSPKLQEYIDILVEKRKSKGLTPEQAKDLLIKDVNFYGTLMVTVGDADGMVSGAMHTTAATIRPGLQVLRPKGDFLCSSIFFMCLPEKVLVYGDCAVNPNPTPKDLAVIAINSADTAAAFGFDPRVAMLSYSTLGSGAGPDVAAVTEAIAIVREKRPDIKVEGPLQYDASIDPSIAGVKIKGENPVAGKANVFIFPDLNTGNNTYKAVQQSTGTVAMGPVIQGFTKPVNDLSRGCTVLDIINTVTITSIQAQFDKKKAN
uniref:Phosphate acetyltransferase n=1 Tax=Polytomella parva TaxID=51329 RepID=A0A7S0VCB8_9CHLO|mmetsp:Transcript_3277/g.5448  ORF Transcript_3277/g.5448 Transcript_3277/m.5448 type:complete len:584 (+) Transcript_3277:83-1834(+)|eukprot:CAMPEP_0175049788 /NCGR_PEP_ID=MMETSP0052_2-20121109/6914_1 /TAXON_ID=51329 ORGANISM="Polytomella parva, Strain SAG 63-3" /NCGR_SAMPLE_ID=MMETSP0052_2 /ASSEMBLY_ACC=CAM_ASM_000194 /LENGTH=583 /DNA_ID=CAMNT_0016313951 /DNA_START=164 /DNA_END=1915 /DNA_ORIENTATION=-